jgi:release factor glutamine methyltransferase
MSAVLIADCLRGAHDLGKRLEAELLLGKVLNVSRETVFAYPERLLSPEEWAEYTVLWERVQLGEPVAYVLGRKEFFGLDFVVNEAVLIPRPETEHLVEAVIDLVKEIDAPRILDVGTGSGAIALSLVHSLPKARVWASDVSEEALAVARANAVRFELNEVQFFVSDLLSDLEWNSWNLDVMVANLPYIGTETFDFVEKSVKQYEPHLALFAGEDGLRLYDRLFQQVSASSSGRRPRWIVGEFGSLQRKSLEMMIGRYFPAALVGFHTDLAGLDRFFTLNLTHA